MHRLIYKSESTVPMNWKTVGSILATSTRNNDRDGLTGVLLVGKRHFLQVLEGDADKLSATFLRIAHDRRHHRIRLIAFEPAAERLFAKWEMRGVGVFEFDPPVSAELIARHGEEDGEVRFPDEGWRALALTQDIFALDVLPDPPADDTP